MHGVGSDPVRPRRQRSWRLPGGAAGWAVGVGLAALLAGCGGTPYNAADSGVGCSVTVLIPSSGTTLLGTVEATVQGRTFHFSRNVNTISVDCGERASLSATAADPQAHPFTDWTLRGKVSSAARLTVTVDGSLAIRPGFRVPRKPTPSPTPTPSATPSTVTLDQWVSYDPATKSVTWKVVAAYQDVNHGLSFDGEARGAMKVAVPVGWSVTVDFSNVGTVNHSAVIVTPTGTTPVFPGAGTPNPTLGTAPGQTATYTFTASTAGSYRLACLTPGHEGAGMWETFTVTSVGRPTATL